MMLMNILAETQKTQGVLMSSWPDQRELVIWCQKIGPAEAAIMVMLGIVYLLWGFKIFKACVMINAALLGGILGAGVGHQGDKAIAGAVIGAVICAAIAWPTMKYSVAVMGGLAGAALGGAVWRSVDLAPDLTWAGALVGLILFGMLSFIVFRGSVMMYTSLQGAFMFVFGVLGLAYKYHDVAPKLNDHLVKDQAPFLLLIAVCIPAVAGLVFQQHHGGSAGPPGGSPKKA